MILKPHMRGGHNDGIQADTVQAEVLAVGPHAQATKIVNPAETEELARAVSQLRHAIAGLGLQPGARHVLEQDIQGLADATRPGRADERKVESHLMGIADKLKMVGIILREVAGLADPATKIADLLRIPLTFLIG